MAKTTTPTMPPRRSGGPITHRIIKKGGVYFVQEKTFFFFWSTHLNYRFPIAASIPLMFWTREDAEKHIYAIKDEKVIDDKKEVVAYY